MIQETSQFSFRSGIRGAIRWGAVGVVIPAVVVAVLGFVERWEENPAFWSYEEWLRWYLDTLPGPVIGCVIVLMCSGWAAHAPRPPASIGSSLLIVTGLSVFVWILVFSTEITPRRYKGIDHPVFYPSEFLTLILPPLFVAVGLTIVRCLRDTPQNKSRTVD